MTESEIKFSKFEFDTDFFEVSVSGSPLGKTLTENEKYQQAYAEGQAAGRQQAEQDLANQVETALQTLQQAALQMESSQKAYFRALHHQVNQSLTILLEQVLGHAAEHYPQELLDQHLREIIDQLQEETSLVLRLNPAAAEFHQNLAEKSTTIQGLTFTIQPDPALSPSECVVEWQSGGLEAKLENTRQTVIKYLTQLSPPSPEGAPPEEPHEEPAENLEEPTADGAETEPPATPETPEAEEKA
jgi:flagellar assembly protein FliH